MNWIEENRPENTKKTYGRYFNEFASFSERKKLHHRSPVAIASFMKYAVTERPRKLGRDTVTTTIPAAIAAGLRYTDPSALQSPLVREMKKAVQRTVPKEPKVKDPLTPQMIKELSTLVDTSNLEQVRNYFMILVMTLGMLRESEAVNLKKGDLWVEEDEGVKSLHVYIPWSKTDQAGDGHTVLLAEMDDPSLCPLKWFSIYENMRNDDVEWFFYTLGKEPRNLSEKTPNHIVKKLVRSLGLDDETYGSHSCRRGGCTAAIEAGVDLRNVARHGRWKSSAINTYIVDSRDTKLSVSKAIMGELE